jgi:mRNA interferase MazF
MEIGGFAKRAEIWLVRLDPTEGSEIKKTRPALIVSNDANNRFAGTVTVLPITDRGEKIFPFEAALPLIGAGLSKPSKVKCQQVRTIDKARLIKRMGEARPDTILQIEEALKIHLGMF